MLRSACVVRLRPVPVLVASLVLVVAGAPAATANVSEVAKASPPADEEPALDRAGGYVGVGGAFALQNFSTPGSQDDSGSILFRAGYRGDPYLAVEFLGEVLPGFEGDDSVDNDVNGFAVTANAKLLLPLGRVEPWLMAGIGFLDIDADSNDETREDFAFRSAAGLDVHLTPHWALYAEAAYMLPTGSVKRFDYATFGGGVLFRF